MQARTRLTYEDVEKFIADPSEATKNEILKIINSAENPEDAHANVEVLEREDITYGQLLLSKSGRKATENGKIPAVAGAVAGAAVDAALHGSAVGVTYPLLGSAIGFAGGAGFTLFKDSKSESYKKEYAIERTLIDLANKAIEVEARLKPIKSEVNSGLRRRNV